MTNVGLSAFVTSLKRRTLGSISEAIVSDSCLLDRFVTNGDQDAFAALVHRHGPTVLAVCRRLCGDEHLAEDAFQAAFLVLARRAGDVKPREAVRAWLYGVAVRTARGARARAVRRRFREVPMPLVPDRPILAAVAVDSDALQALDEEIARLPQHLRAAVLLCELDGMPRKEAAARLGIPEGTLSSRLGKARKLLALWLRGRGIALSAGALTMLFGSARRAAGVDAALANAATRLAGLGPVPETVATLSREVFRIMLLNKLKHVGLLVVLVATVGSGTLWQARNLTWAEDPPAKPAPAQAEVPKSAGPGHILYGCDGKLYLMDPDGKNERRIELPPLGGRPPTACLSPDGRSLAFWTSGDNLFQPVICVRALDDKGFGTKFELKEACGFSNFFWSPNGEELHVNLGGPTKEARHFRIDVKTRQVTRLNVLKHYLVSDQTRDGKLFLATSIGTKDSWNSKSIHLMTAAGTEEKLLADLKLLADPDGWVVAARLSPDGRRALVTHNGKPCVIDIDEPGVLKPVAGIPKDAEVPVCAWAPNGKHIVYIIGTVHWLAPEDLKKFESRLIVADPDGGNAKVVRSVKGKMLTGVDWR
ncbi:MAG TPA: sigma-70 family RNA polymerase sigma factor [Gemmataceae bacterium]|nr:sigma-70 family RNA polymerase sigma factor [Gemmataceae bacterium]